MPERGYTLIELLAAIAITGLIAAISTPSFMALRRRAAVRDAAREIRSVFHLTRSRAIARRTNAGVRFIRVGSEWQFSLHDDGDGDGVRNDDIRRGVDRQIAPPRYLWQQPSLVSVALPNFPVIDPDGEAVARTDSPVQFNRSAICSFSPLGESTPGTIYLIDSAGELYAVRVYGATAKIRILRYVASRKKWESR